MGLDNSVQSTTGSKMKWMFGLLFVVSVATDMPQRDGKLLSLFTVVQFPNEECTTVMNPAMSGTCLRADECTGAGNTASGNCASGFGVCCFRFVEATQPTQTVNVLNDLTHIQNNGYPTPVGAVAAPTATNLMFTIQTQAGICAIKLEFIVAVFSQPTFGTPVGLCGNTGGTTGDSLTVTNGGVRPGFGTSGLCGTLTGQHIYVDTGKANVGATVNIQTGTNNFGRSWKILVRQISCIDPDLPPSPSCLQFHTGLTGQITSLNGGFTGQMMIRNLDYDICIRPGPNMCKLTIRQVAGGMGAAFSLRDTNTANQAPAATAVTGRTDTTDASSKLTTSTTVSCTVEYIFVENAENAGFDTLVGAPAAAYPPFFCGSLLNDVNGATTQGPVIAHDFFGGNSFAIGVHSDSTTASFTDTGFDLLYQQSC